MRKTLVALITITAIMMSAVSTPSRAGYYDTSYYAAESNEDLSYAWYHSSYAKHYRDFYNYVDYNALYNAYAWAYYARNDAYYAWLYAPVGSYAEYYAYYAYLYLDYLVTYLYYDYLYGGSVASYTTGGILYAYYSQYYLSQASRTAAGYY